MRLVFPERSSDSTVDVVTDPRDTKPRKHYVQCWFCEASRNATEYGVVEDHNPAHDFPSRSTLVQCDICNGALLFLQEDHGQGFDDDLFRVWPAPVRHLSSAIPYGLRDVHAEARRCFDAKAYTAAVVMVGRTLEGVCIKSEIKFTNLQSGLDQPKKNGLIDVRLFDWTKELRVLRNEGAHFTGKLVSKEDARDALQLCEALLDYMYVLTARFEEFKARRRKGNDPGEADVDPDVW